MRSDEQVSKIVVRGADGARTVSVQRALGMVKELTRGEGRIEPFTVCFPPSYAAFRPERQRVLETGLRQLDCSSSEFKTGSPLRVMEILGRFGVSADALERQLNGVEARLVAGDTARVAITSADAVQACAGRLLDLQARFETKSFEGSLEIGVYGPEKERILAHAKGFRRVRAATDVPYRGVESDIIDTLGNFPPAPVQRKNRSGRLTYWLTSILRRYFKSKK